MGEWLSKIGALVSSFFASAAYFGPLLAWATGVTPLAAFAVLAIYRPYFIGLAGLALVYGIFTTFWKSYRGQSSAAPAGPIFGKDEATLVVTMFFVFFFILLPYARGVDPGDMVVYEGRGSVIEADLTQFKITVGQEPIAGLMPAMSMEYDAESPGLLKNLKPGDRIRFKLKPEGFAFVVTEIAPEKRSPPKAAGG
jgi:Cu(I)/Ag(I) efflux system protein CusF